MNNKIMIWDYDDLFDFFVKIYRNNFELRWHSLVVEYRNGGYAVLKNRTNGNILYIYDPVSKQGEFKGEPSHEEIQVVHHILQTPPLEVIYYDTHKTERCATDV